MFSPLGTEQLIRIVDLQLDALQQRLEDRRLTLDVSLAAKEWLCSHGFDPIYGARPLRRLVQTAIGDALAKEILAGAGRRRFDRQRRSLRGPRITHRPPRLGVAPLRQRKPHRVGVTRPEGRVLTPTRRGSAQLREVLLVLFLVGVEGNRDGDCNPRIVVDRHGVLPVKRNHLAHERRRQRAIGHR